MDADVIVVGSGAAGLTAATTAALLGRSVLVVEKADLIGGTTCFSGGAAWIPLNPHMASAGVEDTREKAEAYFRANLGNHFSEEMVDAYLDNGARMVSFLEENTTAVRFQALKLPDYHQDLPGAAAHSRSIIPLPYDGRQLGPWLKRLRDAKPEMTVFGGMQVDPAEALHLQYSWRNWTSFKVASKLMLRYARDRLANGRGTRMIRGLALGARLLRSAVDAGVQFSTGTPLVRLIMGASGVEGVVVRKDGQEVEIRARRGVILASGGFSANRAMLADAIPHADTHVTIIADTNIGESIAAARAVGATFGPENAVNASVAPGSSRRLRDGTLKTYPHFAFDRCKPGAIIVGKDGRRFVNEAESYHTLARKMYDLGNVPAWLIGDHPFLRRYGMGMARPAPYPYKHLVREGYLIQADTIAELAAKIGVSPDHLGETVSRINRFAETGIDEDFAKGADSYSRSLGDATHTPNPCIGPIRTGPFYALALYVTDAGMTLGLNVDAGARVMNDEGQPIGHLYAAGNDMHSMMRGYYPGGGAMIGPAMTFGYVAGRAVAEEPA